MFNRAGSDTKRVYVVDPMHDLPQPHTLKILVIVQASSKTEL